MIKSLWRLDRRVLEVAEQTSLLDRIICVLAMMLTKSDAWAFSYPAMHSTLGQVFAHLYSVQQEHKSHTGQGSC